MLDVIDQSKFQGPISSGKEIGIYGVLQKTNEDEFKIPYQGNIAKDIYNIAGFNRAYLKDTMSYTYIPSATSKLEQSKISHLILYLLPISFTNICSTPIAVFLYGINKLSDLGTFSINI